MASRLGGNGGDIARARQRDREAKTLYDYLGASPKDTQEQLKIRYQILAKKLHPDSKPDENFADGYYDLSEINAAWEVLKDPVERKKYDRSLQTKEISEGIESMVTKGLETFVTTAIPFLQKTAVSSVDIMQKTADSTAAAVDASTKAAKEVNEQAKRSYGAFEIEQQIKTLEQKSNADKARASKIEKEITALPTKKVPSLEIKQTQQQPSPSLLQRKQQPQRQPQSQSQQQALSSNEANKILRNFQTASSSMKPTPAMLTNDIKVLTDNENKYKDSLKACQSTERATQMAARKVEQALRAEEMAQKKLEEAQLAFAEAKKNHLAAQESDKKAIAEERLAQQSSAKIETVLQTTREKVRVGLLKQQDAFLVSRANELKKEKLEWEKSSEKYLEEAKALRKTAENTSKKR